MEHPGMPLFRSNALKWNKTVVCGLHINVRLLPTALPIVKGGHAEP